MTRPDPTQRTMPAAPSPMTAAPTPAAAAPTPAAPSPLMQTYAPPPVTLTRGRGTEVFDEHGRRYLDFVAGIAVVSLGHCQPDVVEAVQRQSERLWHVSNLYGNELAPEVATTLDRLIGNGQPAGGQVFFANSGAEANECALKLARRWTGGQRHVVISTWDSFHGRTLATLAATGQSAKHAPFQPLPEGFVHVSYDDLGATTATFKAAEAGDSGGVAAVMVEPLQGEGGVVAPSSDYLRGLRQLCDEHDALLILDEIQTGLGRTGSWFAFHAQQLQPDIVTMAKSLGNGMPVGACWARAEVAAAFGPGDHGSTFGGQPLALSATKATLAVMEREGVCGRARARGAQLRDALAGMPGVVQVRGMGLLLAARLRGDNAKEVSAMALDNGLLVNPVRPDAIRLAPPLLVSEAEVDEALGILSGVLEYLA